MSELAETPRNAKKLVGLKVSGEPPEGLCWMSLRSCWLYQEKCRWKFLTSQEEERGILLKSNRITAWEADTQKPLRTVPSVRRWRYSHVLIHFLNKGSYHKMTYNILCNVHQRYIVQVRMYKASNNVQNKQGPKWAGKERGSSESHTANIRRKRKEMIFTIEWTLLLFRSSGVMKLYTVH